MKRSKLWLGIGLVAAGGASGAGIAGKPIGGVGLVPVANAAPHMAAGPVARDRHVNLVADSSAGGEGGEAAAQTAGEPTPIDVYRDIGLIRGHLMVGAELAEMGNWERAEAHYEGAADKLYPRIGPHLPRYGVTAFIDAIENLVTAAKARDAVAAKERLGKALGQVDAAEARMSAKSADPPALALQGAVRMLRIAAADYAGALDPKGVTIKEAGEYEDGRGFMLQAERLIEAHAAALAGKNKRAFADLRANLAELKSAWPATVPPQTAVKTAATVAALVSKIELRAGKLM